MAFRPDVVLYAIHAKKADSGGGGGETGITDISIDSENNLTYTKNGSVHTVGKLADMSKSVYDTDNDGIVDDSEKAGNHTVATNVPADAVFTDTVYDDTELRGEVDNKVTANVNGEVLSIQK